MSRFVFILGHVPVLSSIEARVLLPDLSIESLGDVILIANSASCDPVHTMSVSGGIVKIAREYAQSSQADLGGIIVSALQEIVPAGKITFGISIYGPGLGLRSDKLAMEVKKILKKVGRSVRHVYSKERALNSATLLFNEFGKPGHVEICLIPSQKHTPSRQGSGHPSPASAEASAGRQEGNREPPPTEGSRSDGRLGDAQDQPEAGVGGSENGSIGIFITEAFQDVGEYTRVEEMLKLRDDRSGVLPLRLSKMLLNIAGVKNEHTLLDPFCGSGMLVGVAALQGVQNIIASDSAEKAVHNTLMNLGSLKKVVGRNCERSSFRPTPHKQFVRGSGEIPAFAEASAGRSHGAFHAHNEISRQARDDKGLSWQVEQRDVRELSKYIKPASIDCIVTEPYLGSSNRMANQQERVELSKLYIDSFGEFKKVLKSDSKVLFIFPVFESIQDFSQAQNEIAKMGFAKADLMKEARQFFPGIEEPIYFRPQQRVKRLITMWELNH